MSKDWVFEVEFEFVARDLGFFALTFSWWPIKSPRKVRQKATIRTFCRGFWILPRRRGVGESVWKSQHHGTDVGHGRPARSSCVIGTGVDGRLLGGLAAGGQVTTNALFPILDKKNSSDSTSDCSFALNFLSIQLFGCKLNFHQKETTYCSVLSKWEFFI